jgi:uncharacterized protein (TIGR00255 family)
MIRSMTGYGIAEQTYNAKKVTVEVKTLNSKQLDLQVKLPNELRFAELDFRNSIGAKLQRGKVDVVITITDTDLGDGDYLYRYEIEDLFGNITYTDPVLMHYKDGTIKVEEL